MTQLDRRHFLQSAIATVTLPAGLAAASTAAIAAPQPVCSVPEKWDEEVDVVVIGSGFAGLAAAWEAQKAGKTVAILEKMPVPGGNSSICGGKMTATGCPQQVKHKIKDSIELMMADTFRAGSNMNDPAKVKFLAETQLDLYNWTVNEIGVQWAPNDIFQDGGHTVPRSVWAANGSGSGITSKLLEKLAGKGIKPRMRTYVERLVRDPVTGAMLGVVVRTGYRFPKAASGQPHTIRAQKAVVAAWGGFSSDVAYRSMQDPRLGSLLKSTNQPGATGELWREASAIGAAMIMVDAIQCVPFTNPKEKGFGLAWQFSQNGAGQFGLWINSEGHRFVNELANRRVSADAIFAEQAKKRRCYAIGTIDSLKGLLSFQPDYLKKTKAAGAIDEYQTLEDLCKGAGLPYATVKASVDQVNESVATGKDKVMGRYIDKEFKPLKKGPWYIAEISPKVHHCMGGIKTDVHGQAIDIRTDKLIPGLYAAGECAGGSHGLTRLGCNGVLDALAYGREVGRQVGKL